jgi:phosphate transport system permease protein
MNMDTYKPEEEVDMAVDASTSPVVRTTSLSELEAQLRKQPRIGEMIIEGLLFLSGAISILVTIGIVFVLFEEALKFFARSEVTWQEFFLTGTWQPAIGEFGIWSLINATLVVSVIAMLIALPIGLMVAIFLSEYASARVRNILKPILEVLAGIPTVVFGYFALTFITPILRGVLGDDIVQIYNTFSAGLVVGILIVPLVASMTEDALHAVPRALREGAFGLGATKLETSVRIVLPAALSGVAAAFIVAISRAVGETMVVAIAAGAGSKPAPFVNPFVAAETMTGHMVRISGGDLSYDSVDYESIFAIGLMLFFMTLALNIISYYVVKRFREEAE